MWRYCVSIVAPPEKVRPERTIDVSVPVSMQIAAAGAGAVQRIKERWERSKWVEVESAGGVMSSTAPPAPSVRTMSVRVMGVRQQKWKLSLVEMVSAGVPETVMLERETSERTICPFSALSTGAAQITFEAAVMDDEVRRSNGVECELSVLVVSKRRLPREVACDEAELELD